jgi:tRNA(adenine34) deaminase
VAIDALFLPLDGVVTDTTAAHARAWTTVLDQRGTHVPARRTCREIGRPGAAVLASTTGTAQERRYGPESVVRQGEIFRHLLTSEGVSVREGVLALIQAARDRDVKVAVVTGLGPESVEAVEEATGLAVDDLADAFVCGENGAGALPEGVFRTAADRLDVHPAQGAAVVHTPHLLYDPAHGYGSVLAAGLTAWAVPAAPFDDGELQRAGARGVSPTPSVLIDRLGAALHRLGPSSMTRTGERLEALMKPALEAAREGLNDGEIPIGSVVTDGDGAILGRGCNRVRATGCHTHHAEMAAFDAAAGTNLPDRDGVVLVTTLEPCVMCFGAALMGRVDTIVYAHEAPENGASGRVGPNRAPDAILPRMIAGVRRADSRALLAEWHEMVGSPFTERLFSDAA